VRPFADAFPPSAVVRGRLAILKNWLWRAIESARNSRGLKHKH